MPNPGPTVKSIFEQERCRYEGKGRRLNANALRGSLGCEVLTEMLIPKPHS